MSTSILALLTDKNVNDLRASQSANSILIEARVTKEILLTLAGIKALNRYFIENKKIWMLVERKARKYIMQGGQLDKNAVDQALESLVITLVKAVEWWSCSCGPKSWWDRI